MKKFIFHVLLKPIMVLLFTTAMFVFFLDVAYSQIVSDKLLELGNMENARFEDIKNAMNAIWEKDTTIKKHGWKPYKRWENFWETRLMPNGSYPNIINLFNEFNTFKEKQAKDNKLQSNNKWTALGPFKRTKLDPRFSTFVSNISNNMGRINVVRFNPKNKQEIWVGAASGGLWKTSDDGNSWYNFPFTDFLSIGVSDIAFAPTNPDIIYVATGDHLPWAMNYTIGVIKSCDGGASWQVTNFAYEMKDMTKICKLLIHPNDENNVIIATSNGIYKTNDGGTSWTQKYTGYFKDMIFINGNPDIIIASTFSTSGGTGLFRSTDNGEQWQLIYQLPSVARSSLAVTPANPAKVYALCTKAYYYSFHSLLMSSDYGLSWSVMSDDYSPNILGWKGDGSDYNQGQAWYDLCLNVSPTDENEVYSGAVNIWKSTNSGVNWEILTCTDTIYKKAEIHVDQHEIVFQEGIMYVANDGGLYKTSDKGINWQYLSDGMNITQYYRIGCDAVNPDRITTGCQDNGSKMFKNGEWIQTGGADGMETVCDYSDPDLIYGSAQYGTFGRLNTTTAEGKFILTRQMTYEAAAWTAPFVMDPQNPAVLYAGYYNVWKSTDRGDTWRSLTKFGTTAVLLSLAISPTDSNYVYAASASRLYMSSDCGKTWASIYSSFNTPMTYIAVSYDNPQIIWVSLGGYAENEKVYKFDGNDWTNLSGNLPNVPINTIVVQKNSPENLFIGSDIGVFISSRGTDNWEIYGNGLPNVIVNELEIQYPAKKIRAATYGLGIWETSIPDYNKVQDLKDNMQLITIVPNPSSNSFEFHYELYKDNSVKIEIIHPNGNKITTLVDEWQEAGRHNAVFDVETQHAVSLQSGMYYYRIQIGDRIESGKMVLIR